MTAAVSGLTLVELAPMMRGAVTWIYAIQQGEDGPIKIGIARDPDERLATLQQANPTKLHGLTAFRGTQDLERAIHKEFRSFRIRGEWFEADSSLVDFVWGMDYLMGPFWFREDMPPEMEEFVYG